MTGRKRMFWAVALAAVLAVAAVGVSGEVEENIEADTNKEGSESWTGWAKDKISEGLGFKGSEDSDREDSSVGRDPIEAAGKSKDKITDATTGAGEYAGELKDRAAEKAREANDKATEVKQKASEKAGEAYRAARDEAGERAAAAKEKAEEEQVGWAKEKARQGYEAAKEKAEEAYESGKVHLEAAKEKAEEIKDDVVKGTTTRDEEL